MKTWFAKRENEATKRLRQILEKHESKIDERFIAESKFHEGRRDDYKVFENDDNKLDFWSSTGFHRETPRIAKLMASNSSVTKKWFFKGDIVIFVDPRDVTGRHECTGRVLESPYECSISVPRASKPSCAKIGDKVVTQTVRRGPSTEGFYRVKVLATSIIPGIQHALDHQIERIVEAAATGNALTDSDASMKLAQTPGLSSAKRPRKKRQRRDRIELLTVDQLESPTENKDRKLRFVLQTWLVRYLRNGFAHWNDMVEAQKLHETRARRASKIQTFWRTCIAKQLSWEKRIARQMMRDQERQEKERKEREEKERQERIAYQKFLRENGVTRDGIRYFLNEEEMEAFYEKQLKMCQRIEAQMLLLATGLKDLAFKKWQYYIRNILPPANIDIDGLCSDVKGLRTLLLNELQESHAAKHKDKSTVWDELGDLSQKLRKIADIETERKRVEREEKSMNDPWHPSLNIKLPALPNLGTRVRPNGRMEILDLERYNNFKRYQTGPTDVSCWLVQGAYAKVLFGGYPCGQARANTTKITSRSNSVASLLSVGVDTFVCLLNPEECDRMKRKHERGWLFDKEVDTVCSDMRKELIVGVNSCKEALDFATKRAERGREVGYGKPQQDALDRAEANREKDYKKAKAFYDNFSPNINHIFCPLPKDGSHQSLEDDNRLLDLCKDLENRLRRQERIYIFSLGGSGRCGVVASLLLGRLYGLRPHETFERVQRCHDTQGRFQNNKGSLPVSCPRIVSQIEQVTRLLQHSEPAYDSTLYRTQNAETPGPTTIKENCNLTRGAYSK